MLGQNQLRIVALVFLMIFCNFRIFLSLQIFHLIRLSYIYNLFNLFMMSVTPFYVSCLFCFFQFWYIIFPKAVTYLEFFGQTSTNIKPRKLPPWLAPSEKVSKIVPLDTIHSLALSVLWFLCKTFSKLLKLSLQIHIFQ